MKIELEVNVNGVDENYTLQYTRDAIKVMESKGFDFNNLDAKFTTNADLMLEGALKMHHGTMNATVRRQVMDAIYDQYDAVELYAQLVEMCMDSIPAIKDSVSEGSQKKKPVLVR